jgi:geranylgeranyl pyrophosphate synthase
VTLPVVKALGRMNRPDRERFMRQLEGQPEDQAIVDAMVAEIEATGALDATSQAARDLVESAWVAVDPLLEPSIVKIMLRSFGWFVLERHY